MLQYSLPDSRYWWCCLRRIEDVSGRFGIYLVAPTDHACECWGDYGGDENRRCIKHLFVARSILVIEQGKHYLTGDLRCEPPGGYFGCFWGFPPRRSCSGGSAFLHRFSPNRTYLGMSVYSSAVCEAMPMINVTDPIATAAIILTARALPFSSHRNADANTIFYETMFAMCLLTRRAREIFCVRVASDSASAIVTGFVHRGILAEKYSAIMLFDDLKWQTWGRTPPMMWWQ